MDLVDEDMPAQRFVATFPTEAFSGDRTDNREGGIFTESNHLLASADFATGLPIDGFRRFVLATFF